MTGAERDAIDAFATAVIVIAPAVGVVWDHARHTAAARVEAARIVSSTAPTTITANRE